jgi:hypothetical protein
MNPANQYREVIKDTLLKFQELGGAKYSEDAVELLVMVAAHESLMGRFIKQVKGPALGIFQMEPATHDDIWRNFISKDRKLDFSVAKFLPSYQSLVNPSTQAELLATDLRYATVLARVFFMRFKEPIPSTDIGKAEYCKKYWNTELGKATITDYFNAYRRTV